MGKSNVNYIALTLQEASIKTKTNQKNKPKEHHQSSLFVLPGETFWQEIKNEHCHSLPSSTAAQNLCVGNA